MAIGLEMVGCFSVELWPLRKVVDENVCRRISCWAWPLRMRGSGRVKPGTLSDEIVSKTGAPDQVPARRGSVSSESRKDLRLEWTPKLISRSAVVSPRPPTSSCNPLGSLPQFKLRLREPEQAVTSLLSHRHQATTPQW
ncbi:hypothetical protein NDU88_002585 [Pleurodeles waltl]|uniref:Uncharacterized protein n=1 Tax=Pleurodeles waltl TaxID=8319 RepID=A0AAV7M1E6_PLEWA|nr:hypothetical protein NDU88_002585 [Pleurodeles waltl]